MRAQAAPREEHSEPLGKVLDFMQVLWSVDHALQRLSKRMAQTAGVTGPQRLVLRILGRRPGASAGALARILRLHKSTLTGVIQRLEQRGLIARKDDPADGRRALFELTAPGRKIDQLRGGTVEAAVRRALLRLSADKLRAAEEVLETVAEELGREE